MEYKEYLAKRGYSNQLIEEAITEAKATPKEQLIGLTQKNQDSSSSRQFPLVIKFNPKLPPMSKYIHKHNHPWTHLPDKEIVFKIIIICVL